MTQRQLVMVNGTVGSHGPEMRPLTVFRVEHSELVHALRE